MPVTESMSAAITDAVAELSSTPDASPASDAPDPSPEPQVTSESDVTPASPATPEAATGESITPAAPDNESTIPATGSIPVERHKAILNKYRPLADEAKQLAWAKQYDPADVQEKLKILQFAETNPREFMRRFEAAVRTDPRFAHEFAPPAPAAPAPAPEPKPEPDVILSDGTLTYSQGQLDKLLEWREQQTIKRFEPIEKAYRGNQAWSEAVQRASSTLADARTNWAGFSAAEQDIKTFMVQHPSATLEQAYRSVVVPKFQSDETRIRAEERQKVLDELRSKATVTTTRAQPGGTLPQRDPETGRFKSAGDLAREVYESLSRDG